MPVRSLNSSVFRWPDANTVDQAVRQWAKGATEGRADVRAIGYFGSYARGESGVGSDLDLLIIVADTDLPFERRGLAWDTSSLPVPADLLVYTQAEWDRLRRESAFGHRAATELVQVYPPKTG